jgi:hypothetical protein
MLPVMPTSSRPWCLVRHAPTWNSNCDITGNTRIQSAVRHAACYDLLRVLLANEALYWRDGVSALDAVGSDSLAGKQTSAFRISIASLLSLQAKLSVSGVVLRDGHYLEELCVELESGSANELQHEVEHY